MSILVEKKAAKINALSSGKRLRQTKSLPMHIDYFTFASKATVADNSFKNIVWSAAKKV